MEFERTLLIYDVPAFENLAEETRKVIEEKCEFREPFSEENIRALRGNQRIILYLSDNQIKLSLSFLREKDCAVGFLPHPKATHAIEGYLINEKPEQALEEIFSSERILKTDLLMCNEAAILNYFAVGEIVSFITEKVRKRPLKQRLNRFFSFLRKLKSVKAGLFTFQTENKDPLETAATDILIVQHGKNSMVSRLLSEETCTNNSLFHVFIFAPRSFMQLIQAYFLKIFFGKKQSSSAFKFLGQLKVPSLTIESNQSFEYDIDGVKTSGKKLSFRIEKGLKLIPSKNLIFDQNPSSEKIYRIENLPRDKVKEEVVSKSIPFISHASTSEYKELFTTLRENSKPGKNYVVLMTLSVILATLGIFADSSPVIIGAMILAPLMSPVISLSMGVLRQDRSLIKNSLLTVGVGVLVGYICSIIFTFITPIGTMNEEISSRINPNIIDLGIAIISGAAGAYAHAKEEIAKTLAGVAIAVALVPPLAVSGIGLAWGSWDVFFGAFLLLITNLTGMVLAGSFVFLLNGYSPFHLARKGLLISFFVVLSLSVPLSIGFLRVVKENRIVQSLNSQTIQDMRLKNVKVSDVSPLRLSVDLVGNKIPSEKEIAKIKEEVSAIVGQDVILEVGFRLER
ncbi:MAG: DUF389 domain-containing protein [Brumimicrobium sp.]|nr:DUF389 domain-containing protein [Brumimicrobium sp.]